MTNDVKPLSADELNIERHRAGSCWGLQDACGRVVGLLATIDALQAELAERDRQILALREALAPFSDESKEYDGQEEMVGEAK